MRTIKEILHLDYPPTDSDFVSAILRYKLEFKSFCGEVLEYDLQPFHLEWFQKIMSGDRISIVAPTGFGKTTIIGNAYILWRAFFEKNKQFLIISNSMPQSIKILEEIRLLIENNEFLKDLMPDQSVRTNTWTKTEIRTKTNCKIMCKPYNPNIKGYHVDYILCDEAATYRDQEIFFRYVVTRVTAKLGKIAVISTPVDLADLMVTLEHNKEWDSKTYPAVNEAGVLLWPKKFTNARLVKIRDEIGPYAFEREYLCNPSAASDNVIFFPDLIEDALDYQSTFGPRLSDDSKVYIGCDFAIASGPKADFDSFIVVERVGDKAVIRHGETHKGFSIAAKMMRIEQLYQMYRADRVVIDPSNIGHAIAEKLREKMIPFDAPDFSSQNRAKMLLNVRELLEGRRLIIPRGSENPATMKFTSTLMQELLSFVETKTKAGFITYSSTSTHDDTAMSLCLACKLILEQKECLDFIAI